MWDHILSMGRGFAAASLAIAAILLGYLVYVEGYRPAQLPEHLKNARELVGAIRAID